MRGLPNSQSTWFAFTCIGGGYSQLPLIRPLQNRKIWSNYERSNEKTAAKWKKYIHLVLSLKTCFSSRISCRSASCWGHLSKYPEESFMTLIENVNCHAVSCWTVKQTPEFRRVTRHKISRNKWLHGREEQCPWKDNIRQFHAWRSSNAACWILCIFKLLVITQCMRGSWRGSVSKRCAFAFP